MGGQLRPPILDRYKSFGYDNPTAKLLFQVLEDSLLMLMGSIFLMKMTTQAAKYCSFLQSGYLYQKG